MIIYYCLNCKQEVKPVMGKFQHPHMGIQSAYVCPTCGKPITYKEDNRDLPRMPKTES